MISDFDYHKQFICDNNNIMPIYFDNPDQALQSLSLWNNPEYVCVVIKNPDVDDYLLQKLREHLAQNKPRVFMLVLQSRKLDTEEIYQTLENQLLQHIPDETGVILRMRTVTDMSIEYVSRWIASYQIVSSSFTKIAGIDFPESFFNSLKNSNNHRYIRFSGVKSEETSQRIVAFFSEEVTSIDCLFLDDCIGIDESVVNQMITKSYQSGTLLMGIEYLKSGGGWKNYKETTVAKEKKRNFSMKYRQKDMIMKQVEEMLKSGEQIPYGRSKLMFVGESRAGKTTTIKSLLHQPFDEAQSSTKGIARVKVSNWSSNETENSYFFLEHLRKGVYGSTKHFSPSTSKNNKTITQAKTSTRRENIKFLRNPSLLEPDSDTGIPKMKLSKEDVKKIGEAMLSFRDGEAEEETNLSFTIWDFGGQKIFYTMHHLFLTEYGCYVVVFDMEKILNEDNRPKVIEYLKFWLYTKKIHAVEAPILLVGTRLDKLFDSDLSDVQKIIEENVLGESNFNIYWNKNDKLSFFPINNVSGDNIEHLRNEIESVVSNSSYVNTSVPLAFMRFFDMLSSQKQEYISLSDCTEIRLKCGLNDRTATLALEFLNQRGLVTYLTRPKELNGFVVLDPQWVIEAITLIIFDRDDHPEPKYDSSFNFDFINFMAKSILTENLLQNIWTLAGYTEDMVIFFRAMMTKSLLMCDFKFDKVDSYLVPALFARDNAPLKEKIDDEDENSNFSGPFFILDFSGDYNGLVSPDDNNVRYLPFGVFERLVCLCVTHSETFEEKIFPEVSAEEATFSFGTVIIKMTCSTNFADEKLWITVALDDGAEYHEMEDIINVFESMTNGLLSDYFSVPGKISMLDFKLLLGIRVSQYKFKVAEYYMVKERFSNSTERTVKFQANKRSNSGASTVCADDFAEWFIFDKPPVSIHPDPVVVSESKPEDDSDMVPTNNPSPAPKILMENMPPLPENFEYHLYLSYSNKTCSHVGEKQELLLEDRNYRAMKSKVEQISKCFCFVLILSKDVWEDPKVLKEIKAFLNIAPELNFRRMIILMHPDTDEKEDWLVQDYIDKAPNFIHGYLDSEKFIHLQLRVYLEKAVNSEIDRRYNEIYETEMS